MAASDGALAFLDDPATAGRLADWMEARGLGRGPITAVEPLAGGTQNILERFRRDSRDYVLRRPPRHLRANSNETMRREARVLGALSGTDIPHARLIAAGDDEETLGAAFYLMEPVYGFNPLTALPALHARSPDVRHRMGLALVETAAAIGNLDVSAIGLDGFGRPDNFLGRQVGRWRSQLESYHALPGWSESEGLPETGAIGAWLEANLPASFTPGLMHGDFHFANVMYRTDGPEIAAVVDWELATVGAPLLDLGWVLATWPEGDEGHPGNTIGTVSPWSGFPDREELIEHYRARSRHDLSAIVWYAVLACYKLGIITEGTRARACAGQVPAETGDLLHGTAMALCRRAMSWIG